MTDWRGREGGFKMGSYLKQWIILEEILNFTIK
jgi:hypothetical protein